MKEGFTKLKEYMTQFPIINIYQTQTNLQVGIMDPEASILEYYLESRKELEKIMLDAALITLPGTHYAYLENLPRVVTILDNFF